MSFRRHVSRGGFFFGPMVPSWWRLRYDRKEGFSYSTLFNSKRGRTPSRKNSMFKSRGLQINLSKPGNHSVCYPLTSLNSVLRVTRRQGRTWKNFTERNIWQCSSFKQLFRTDKRAHIQKVRKEEKPSVNSKLSA